MKIIDKLFKILGYERTAKVVPTIPELPTPKLSAEEELSVNYISDEFSKIAPSISIKGLLVKTPLQELTKLVEVFSKYYRNNAVYDYLFQKGYSWSIQQIDTKDLYFTKINEKTNKYLEKLSNPYHVLALIVAWRKVQLPDDFELLRDWRHFKVPSDFKPMVIEDENRKLKVIDGNHRVALKAQQVWGGVRPFKMQVFLGRR